ncbi:MAG: aldo/keto reductase [Synergistaceae bacterium]|nr:aldo/keto reductase [Synergistaceae bacterium]
MLYRRMPRVKEELSILGFGCMRLPMDGKTVDESAASRMMNKAVERGINYVDTAWPYHGGEGEAIVGRLLAGGLRGRVNLATKLPSWLVKTREDMDMYLDRQLKALQTDHLDMYLLHSLSADRWENLSRLDVMSFMEKAKRDGKIRYIGFSFHDGLSVFKKIAGAYDWDFCQVQYNFLDTNYQAGAEGIKYAAGRDIGIVIMEPLRGGSLTVPMPEELRRMAADLSYRAPTLADLGLRWIWNQPEISVVLSGMSSMDQLQQNIESAAHGWAGGLKPGEPIFVDKAVKFFQSKMRVLCTSCGYCKPCPQGVDIPQCFTNLNNAALTGNWAAQKANYNYILADDRDGNKASACVECGLCETKCPQHLPIRERLKEVVAAFEKD